MIKKKILVKSLLLLLSFFIFSKQVLACTPNEYGVPLCAYFTRADAVFMGEVIKIERKRDKEDNDWIRTKVFLKVIKNFKGVKSSTFTLFTSDWRTACGLNVKKGQTWIVYAKYDEEDKHYYSYNISSEYKPAEDNKYLGFLKTASEGKLETSISGMLAPYGVPSRGNDKEVEITIEGNGVKKTTFTNEYGRFEVSPLNAGSYKVKMKFSYPVSLLWSYQNLKYFADDGKPNFFEYEISLNNSECDYKFFELYNKTQ